MPNSRSVDRLNQIFNRIFGRLYRSIDGLSSHQDENTQQPSPVEPFDDETQLHHDQDQQFNAVPDDPSTLSTNRPLTSEQSMMRNPATRRIRAKAIREEAAQIAFLREPQPQFNNGEENEYRDAQGLSYIANFTKGLPHDSQGRVNSRAYRMLLRALNSGDPNDFARIPLGPNPVPMGRTVLKFVNPQAGLAFDLEGPDGPSLSIPPAPRIDGAENSAEMAELYLMALLRDVSFKDYGTGANSDSGSDLGAGPSRTADAATSLSTFTDFRGPKNSDGQVTPQTLFRGITPGDLVGPYLSQFLLKGNAIKGLADGQGAAAQDGFIQYGTLLIDQRQKTVDAGSDFMTSFSDWLDIQNGLAPTATDQFDGTRRFIRNARDLANYVHFDQLYEAYLNACLILLASNAPFDQGNPYLDSANQDGFGTFGGTHILTLVTEVATRALKAVWYQKWYTHRRLRPEAFGGLIHLQMTGEGPFPIDSEILDWPVLSTVQGQTGTYLLPMAFPEGSPMHPAYGAGHATVAGACVTILKAFFDESYILPGPYYVANNDGTALETYGNSGPSLTVGGELNKIAANIAIGRNMAGVHWRTDYIESIRLGEAIAIGILQEQRATFNESHFFTLTKFDGQTILI